MAPTKSSKRKATDSIASNKKIQAGVPVVGMDADAEDGDSMPLNLLAKPSTPSALVFHRDATKIKNLLTCRSSEQCKKACMIISI